MNKIIIKKKLKESLIKNLYAYEINICDSLKGKIIEILEEYFVVNEKSVQIKFEKLGVCSTACAVVDTIALSPITTFKVSFTLSNFSAP